MKWYYPIIALPIYLLCSLPLWALYGVSTGLYWILYYAIGYRKKVVRQNLRNSFPEKSEVEILLIERAYYKHMVDVIVETLKLATLSKNQLKKRVRFTNIELITQLEKEKQSYVFVLGHQGNWEWCGPAFASYGIGTLYGIYHPLSNSFFNWLMIKIRTRHGMKLVPMNQVMRGMAKLKEEFAGMAFIADQTPAPETAFWTTFLNQETPVFVGTEKLAKRFNFPVIYASNTKVKRGYYHIEFKLLSANPSATTNGWITEQHTRFLEQDIRANPANWLWSHRRWKHKPPR